MSHRLVFVLLALIGAVSDLWTKTWAFDRIPPGGREIPVIPGFFSIGRTTNEGIVFGLFAGAGSFFQVVSILAVPIILGIYWAVRKPRWIVTLSLGLVMAGTLGNMVDRIEYGHVRDFIKFFWKNHTWPLFNLADSYISVGVILLSIDMLFFDDKRKSREPEPSSAKPTEPMPRIDVSEPDNAQKADGPAAAPPLS
ncbi:MAG: signal peptidase II [Planctomycetes bacterium]|nr:signal peptidase II [Planctomycetota bacterium]